MAKTIPAFFSKELRLLNANDRSVVEDIVDDYPDAIHSSNCDGEIVYANKKASSLYGYPPEELIGMSIYDLYSNPERTHVGLNKLIKLGKLVVRSKIKPKTGEAIDVIVKSYALYDKAGDYVQSFSVLEDITEHRKFQRELANSNRLSMIGKFAAGIVHDISNPLTIIKGVGELISEEPRYKEDMTLQSNVRFLQNAVNKIQHYSRRLLDLPNSRISAPVTQLCLVEIITEALAMTEPKLSKLKINVDSDMPLDCLVDGCMHQLEQVFINILTNACDALTDSSDRKISIKITVCDRDGIEGVVVAIADSGIGIPAQVRSRIFEPFYTTKGEQGTGIGLAISHEIVSLHGGSIKITDNQPTGVVFEVFLPKTQRQQQAS
ncbi:MAG: ATP-binding protein [Pseudomonadota bacterium]|nr:ATP-binding protein [Pseudomonadota bacterium]